jgi:ribosomal protein S18 acetylase RimI-like enzyme
VEAKLRQPMESARYQVITALGQVRGEVNSLGVLKSHRRRGIGRALMQEAERWLADRGATVIELDTLATSPRERSLLRGHRIRTSFHHLRTEALSIWRT